MRFSASSSSIRPGNEQRLEPPSDDCSPWASLGFTGCLLAICLLALAVRSPFLTGSLWIDELHTAWTIAGPWSAVPHRAAQGNNLPFYFYAMKANQGLFGPSELSLRWPSLLAGLLMIPLTSWIVVRTTNRYSLGLAAALLLSLDRNALFYSTEARPYALVQLIATLQLMLLPALAATPTPARRAINVGLSGILFALHPTTALLFPGILAIRYVLARHSGASRSNIAAQLAVDTLATLLLWLPALPVLADVYSRRANWARIVTSESATLVRAVTLLGAHLYLPAAILFLALERWTSDITPTRRTAVNSGNAAPQSLNRQPVLNLPTLVIWTFTPLLIAWLSTRFDVAHVFLRRYLWCVAAGVIWIAMLLISDLRRRSWQKLALAATVATAIAYWGPQTVSPNLGREPWREALAVLSQVDPQGRFPLVVRPYLLEADSLTANDWDRWSDYLLLPVNTPLYKVPQPSSARYAIGNALSERLPTEACNMARQQGGVWLLARGAERDTEVLVESIQRQISQLDAGPWTPTIDQRLPGIRIVLWTLEQRRSAARLQDVPP